MDLLFLPGFACTSAIWLPTRAALEPEHSVTLVDWPRDLTSGFHVPLDFANWLKATLGRTRFDCVAGHSMGGLVALDWLRDCGGSADRLVLVESFLLPAPPFFRNLVLNQASPQAKAVRQMMQDEKGYYSCWLSETLRLVNMTDCLPAGGLELYALYGDRGCGDPDRVTDALGWPSTISARVQMRVIAGSCHFPMLENTDGMAQALREILGQPLPGRGSA